MTESCPPPCMDHAQRQRVREASFRAQRVYPGPVGALLHSELLSWETFGYRLDSTNLIMSVVNAIEQTPEPEAGAA